MKKDRRAQVRPFLLLLVLACAFCGQAAREKLELEIPSPAAVSRETTDELILTPLKLTREVKDFVLKSPETKSFLEELTGFLGYLIPKFMEEGKSILTIAIGCTGGKHRSVVIGEKLKASFQQAGYHSKIYHRDIFK